MLQNWRSVSESSARYRPQRRDQNVDRRASIRLPVKNLISTYTFSCKQLGDTCKSLKVNRDHELQSSHNPVVRRCESNGGPVFHRRQIYSVSDPRAGRVEGSKPAIVLVNLDERRENPGKGSRRRGIELLKSYGRAVVPKRASWTRSPLSN